MPFVAIIGGFWNLPADEAAKAIEMAQEIGKALADARMGLVVYFSNKESLEPHVVSGYVKALPKGIGADSILVRFAESQKGEVVFDEQTTHPEIFKSKLFPGLEWEAPFYRSLVYAEGVDAVLLMAGGTSTLIAGQIAVARPLPVLAIDQFGGSASIIRTELARLTDDYPSSSTHTIEQSAAWLRNKCLERAKEREKQLEKAREKEKEALLKEQEIARKEMKYLKAISQRNKTIWAACAFASLLATIFFGVAQTPAPNYYSTLMFAGLIAAGATGALVRSVFWGAEKTPPNTSLLFGAVAGFVVGLAYLIPQWIGAHGVLEPSATVVGATDKIQFVSAVLVAISAGVGFDTVFNRLRKQAEVSEIGHPNQKQLQSTEQIIEPKT